MYNKLVMVLKIYIWVILGDLLSANKKVITHYCKLKKVVGSQIVEKSCLYTTYARIKMIYIAINFPIFSGFSFDREKIFEIHVSIEFAPALTSLGLLLCQFEYNPFVFPRTKFIWYIFRRCLEFLAFKSLLIQRLVTLHIYFWFISKFEWINK